jgi:His-Xaa-Ser system protein HxsD
MVSEVTVDFDGQTQSLDALRAAAYRLIGRASCQIEKSGDRLICRIVPNASDTADDAALKATFIDLVTDENLRESLAVRTAPVRNLILSLAFGSLAHPDPSP